jgi:hypothetical protein
VADSDANGNDVSIGLAMRGRLFLGFVENASEIEVLSYNEAAGRFEFQLVQNYCEGCVPRIVYARRAICTTCHQGAAPIFSQRPWNETNGHGKKATAADICQHTSSRARFFILLLRRNVYTARAHTFAVCGR